MDRERRNYMVLNHCICMSYHLIATENEEDFIRKATALICREIAFAIHEHQWCSIGLSGGGTPQPVYGVLAKESVEWGLVRFFLLDERYVQPDHPDSNQCLVRETLLRPAGIPEEHFVCPDTALSLSLCVEAYAKKLKVLWEDHLPDMVILGMGDDGHIASLFPPLSQEAMDDSHLVMHTVNTPFCPHDRITLTLNPILAAQTHIILLRGENKKQVWEEMLQSPEGHELWPLKAVLEQERVFVVTCWSS